MAWEGLALSDVFPSFRFFLFPKTAVRLNNDRRTSSECVTPFDWLYLLPSQISTTRKLGKRWGEGIPRAGAGRWWVLIV